MGVSTVAMVSWTTTLCLITMLYLHLYFRVSRNDPSTSLCRFIDIPVFNAKKEGFLVGKGRSLNLINSLAFMIMWSTFYVIFLSISVTRADVMGKYCRQFIQTHITFVKTKCDIAQLWCRWLCFTNINPDKFPVQTFSRYVYEHQQVMMNNLWIFLGL